MSKCDGVTKAPGIASFEGVLNGLGGLVGLSGFWNPVDDTGLTNVSNEYAKQQSAITNKLNNMKEGAIKKVEQEYWQDEIDAIVASNKFHQELEDDKIQKNTLLIQIIIGILLIIIIYLVVL